MGWLDKLLGRERGSAGTAEAAPAEEQESEAGAAEDRVAEERDDSFGLEGRRTPGTG